MTSQPSYAYSAGFERADRPAQLYIANEGVRGEPACVCAQAISLVFSYTGREKLGSC